MEHCQCFQLTVHTNPPQTARHLMETVGLTPSAQQSRTRLPCPTISLISHLGGYALDKRVCSLWEQKQEGETRIGIFLSLQGIEGNPLGIPNEV